jgi:hypothetical protein
LAAYEAVLDSARTMLQVEIGFGDAVTPAPESVRLSGSARRPVGGIQNFRSERTEVSCAHGPMM